MAGDYFEQERQLGLSSREERLDILYSTNPDDFKNSLKARHSAIRILSQDDIDCSKFPWGQAGIEKLKASGNSTYGRVAVEIFSDMIDRGDFSDIRKETFLCGPRIAFLTPLRKGGVNPSLGILNTASYLESLGLPADVYDLRLRGEEYARFMKSLYMKGSPWLVSFGNLSNPIQAEDVETILRVHEDIKSYRKISEERFLPRMMAGGMGAAFNCKELFKQTLIEIIPRQYGSIAMSEMVFDSEYQGPEDRRSSAELFGGIPNLMIKEGNEIRLTREIEIGTTERKVVAAAHDPKKANEGEYWRKGIEIDICSPLSFNPSQYLLEGEIGESEGLHPDDIMRRLKMVRVLSSTGDCQRKCKPCQYCRFDSKIYAHPAEVSIGSINQTLDFLPDAEMVGFIDDDFLFGKDAGKYIEALKGNEKTRGRVTFSMETVPQAVKNAKVFEGLGEAGFRVVLLGIENPVERVARDIGKLRETESWDDYRNAPYRLRDMGFEVRASMIPFYPTIMEGELPEMMKGIVDYINNGVHVVMFPLVIPERGTPFEYGKTSHRIRSVYHSLPDGKQLRVDYAVLPDDEVVQRVALEGIRNTPARLENVIRRFGFEEVYPRSLQVLTALYSCASVWEYESGRGAGKEVVTDVKEYIENGIRNLSEKSKWQFNLTRYFDESMGSASMQPYDVAESLMRVEPTEEGMKDIIHTLGRWINFGDRKRIQRAIEIYNELACWDGARNPVIEEHIRYRSFHNDPDIKKAAEQVLALPAKSFFNRYDLLQKS